MGPRVFRTSFEHLSIGKDRRRLWVDGAKIVEILEKRGQDSGENKRVVMKKGRARIDSQQAQD